MSFLSSLFGAGDAQQTGDNLDDALAKMNERDYAPGGALYNKAKAQGLDPDKNYQAIKDHEEYSQTGWVEGQLWGQSIAGATELLYDPAQWWEDTKTGAKIVEDAAPEIGQGIGDFLWRFIKTVFKSVPWPVWVAAGIAAFYWIGGFAWLARFSKGRLAR